MPFFRVIGKTRVRKNTMSERINIDKDVLENAKFSASKVDDKYLRKRAFALNIAANATAKFLNEKGLKIQVNHSLYKSPSFAKEIELADIYLGQTRFDVRVTFNDRTFCVPKSHLKYDVRPNAYIVVKLDSNLCDIEFLGFVAENKLEYPNSDSEYYTFPLSVLNPIETFVEYAQNIEVHSHPYDEKEHENVKEICANFIDNQVSEADKIYFIKHVASCPVCRETFRDMNDFDDIVSQVKNYKELLNDSTLSVLSGNKAEVDLAAMENLALVENAQEDDADLLTVEPDSMLGAVAAGLGTEAALEGVAAVGAEDLVESVENMEEVIEDVANDVLSDFVGEIESVDEVLEADTESQSGSVLSESENAQPEESQLDRQALDVESLEEFSDIKLDESLLQETEDVDSEFVLGEESHTEEIKETGFELPSEPEPVWELEEQPEGLHVEDDEQEELVEHVQPQSPEDNVGNDEAISSSQDDDLLLLDSGDEDLFIEEHEEQTLLDEVQEVEMPEQEFELQEELPSENNDESIKDISIDSETEILNSSEEAQLTEVEEGLELEDLETIDSLESVEEVSYAQTPVELKYDDEEELSQNEMSLVQEEEIENTDTAGVEDMLSDEDSAEQPAEIMQEEEKHYNESSESDESIQELLDDDLLALLSDDDTSQGSVESEKSDEPEQIADENATSPDAIEDESQVVNDGVENLYAEQELPVGEQVEFDISQEPVSEETIKKTKKLAVSAALIMLLAVGGAAGAWYIQHKNAVDKEAMDSASGDQMFDFQNQGENAASSTSAALPQDINKSMTNSFSDKPAAISITKLSWQISEKLAVEPSVKEYLQTAGKNIQMNLQNDLANAADVAFNNSVKVSFEIAPDNTLKGIQVLESSGSDKIDEVITKSIRNTLKYVSVPKLQNYTSDYFLTLIINF